MHGYSACAGVFDHRAGDVGVGEVAGRDQGLAAVATVRDYRSYRVFDPFG